jgi:hypothetical protein
MVRNNEVEQIRKEAVVAYFHCSGPTSTMPPFRIVGITTEIGTGRFTNINWNRYSAE